MSAFRLDFLTKFGVSFGHDLPYFHHVQIRYFCDLLVLLYFLDFVGEKDIKFWAFVFPFTFLIGITYLLFFLLFYYFSLHFDEIHCGVEATGTTSVQY